MSQHDEVTSEHPKHDDTTTIETLLDDRDRATDPDPMPAAPSAPTAPTAPTTQGWAQGQQFGVPEFKSGPAPTTSVFGLLGLLGAIAVLVSQATDLDIPWGVVGPVAVVGAGVLLVVLGLAGLRGQRFRA
ncbi:MULTISPECIES: hypothetical protein [unclassified Knoellia]|uniref:hypothetical protein n=1 Tax=Knoellia altitudinis TaxID=3404795 RepID=UPI00361A966F